MSDLFPPGSPVYDFTADREGFVVMSGPDASDGWLDDRYLYLGVTPDANEPGDVWWATVDDLCDDGSCLGFLWPCESDSDGAHPYVERCDTCKRFETDEEAAAYLAAKHDGIVVWALLYGDVKRGRWQPAVYAPAAKAVPA